MFCNSYVTAQEAFEDIYSILDNLKVHENGTKKIYSVSIKILEPTRNLIKTEYRNWNNLYGEREWKWYLSKDRSVKELKKHAPIWDKMHNGDDIVNSNYGYLWSENNQLEKTIQQLRDNKLTRQAWITIFDGKRKDEFVHDTPCTIAIGFIVEDGLLCMSVLMRSNDLWFGFCNDQYCFSKLQMYVAKELCMDVGWYHHFASDMHIYKKHFGLN